MKERMVRDVHPAEVVTSNGRILTDVRAFLTTDRLIVWKQTKGEIEKVMEIAGTFSDTRPDKNALGKKERIEVFSNDLTIVINKGRGCGCASKLKYLGTPVSWD